MRSTKSTEWKPRQGPDLETNVRHTLYHHHDAACRDAGRFVAGVPEVDRFWRKVRLARGDACWLWAGGVNQWGYGTFRRTLSPGVHRSVLAHRRAWELLVGPIAEGLTLDHLCEERLCVRPSHLEPVTNAENVRRRHARRRAKNGATS